VRLVVVARERRDPGVVRRIEKALPDHAARNGSFIRCAYLAVVDG
jgi:hypothetical protein